MNCKKVFTLLAFILTTSAFAAGISSYADSWDDIRYNSHVRLLAPTVSMTHQYGTAQVSVFDVCWQDDSLLFNDSRGLKVCVSQRGLPNRASCINKRVWPVAPLISTHNVCSAYSRFPINRSGARRCIQWTAVTEDYSRAQTVAVYKALDRSDYGRRAPSTAEALFEKDFYIPSCL